MVYTYSDRNFNGIHGKINVSGTTPMVTSCLYKLDRNTRLTKIFLIQMETIFFHYVFFIYLWEKYHLLAKATFKYTFFIFFNHLILKIDQVDQIFLSPQMKQSVTISNKLVYRVAERLNTFSPLLSNNSRLYSLN